jgi:hypothetical protein
MATGNDPQSYAVLGITSKPYALDHQHDWALLGRG